MEKPNIVFIMADDMGYGDVGCYNSDSKIPTPNMDRLAREGIRFTDLHSPFAVCSPTRYGVLTGRYCWRTPLGHGVFSSYEPPLIEKDRLTVAGLLKRHGYTTAAIGKWHLGLGYQIKDGEQVEFPPTFIRTTVDRAFEEKLDFTKPLTGGPLELGFDYFFGTSGCSTGGKPFGFIENDRFTEEMEYCEEQGMTARGWENKDVDPTFAQKAVEFIEQQADRDDPFFLYLVPSAPHEPCRREVVPEFARDQSKAGARGDLVWLVDWMVGEVLEALERTGKAGDTLVIVTSDNGATPGDFIDPEEEGNLGASPDDDEDVIWQDETGQTKWRLFGHKSCGDWRGYKAHIWEGGHREPFIARWPGKIEPGTVCDELADLIDFMATCTALVGDELHGEEGQDSRNILPLLLGEQVEEPCRDSAIYQSSYGVYAIRKGDWKFIQGTKGSGGWGPPKGVSPVPGAPGQLYNVKEDPCEQNDLFDQRPELVEKLTLELEARIGEGYPDKNWLKRRTA